MLSSAFAVILSSLLHGSAPAPATLARAEAAETAALAAAHAESAPAIEVRDAKLIFVVGYLEGGFLAAPRGSSDAGLACGGAQVHVRFWADLLGPAWTCAVLRSDLVISYRAGLRVIHALEAKCGSLARAMGAFQTGECRDDLRMTRDRCQLAGLTAKCEAKL